MQSLHGSAGGLGDLELCRRNASADRTTEVLEMQDRSRSHRRPEHQALQGLEKDGSSGTIRMLRKDEAFEVLEVKTRKDQAVGWITLKGNQGTLFLIQWSRRDEEQLKQKQKSLQEGLGAAKEKE
eukprot:g17394.t1